MLHCDPDDLALAALGEPLGASAAGHLAGCRACSAEVAALRRPVEALAPGRAGEVPEVPLPPHVWEAIAAATGVAGRPASVDLPGPTPTPTPARHPARPDEAEPALPAPVDLAAARSRRRRLAWSAGAVAASLLVGLGTGVVLGRDGGGADLSSVALEALPGYDASGRATLVDTAGTLQLRVDLTAPPVTDGYYEVWLLRADAGGVLALGVLDGRSALYPLPPGVDLAAYPVVDVSLEPYDGDPAHSATSVARGQLR